MTREEAARMCEAVVKPTFGTISSNDNNDAYKEAFEMAISVMQKTTEAFDVAIAALRESAHEWVRTTDRLPEEGKTVLVTDGLFVHHGYLIDNRWWSYASCPEGFATTHWMPLPKPPEVEG